ncbi:hypothetical protein RND71_031721 [Anisodus tanguticus]|uniref:phospholipase D n=1 Tax=Anisodus tanguticus TaxID=243964 RepID=A0AAE1RD49_9SOLA|nr:hypothetical protein RND71_031721 [Anisodus tanguticus]
MDLVTERLRCCFIALDVCRKPFTRRRRKGHHRKIITSDPYVTVCLIGANVARTRVISNCQDPVWNEHFKIPLAPPVSDVEFHVKDNDVFGADYIGVVMDTHVPDGMLPEIKLDDDKVKLVREPGKPLPSGGDLTLGELLKYKSEEGVRVVLLVWDDKTSHGKFFIQTVVGTLYTHHQKCVIVDSQASGNNRKITAFIGGLDLCDGCYDTPEHRLFRDLDTVFKDDFHNPTFSAGTKGPRQPWHDLHCKIEGPGAYDVLTNFEQRWRKATKWSEFGRRLKKISHWHDDALIKIERICWITSPSSSVPNDDESLWVSNEEDPENWHVQVFRSIASGSLKGFPKDVFLAESQFTYTLGADNLIPMELALKIASEIREKEQFVVYVVIPMWPEGVPTSASVQEVLYWQRQTMKMMYGIIAQALKSSELQDVHLSDYLNFYCLGNREELRGESKSNHASNGDLISSSQKFGRFMIYVHAKGMIVDDEYVIIFS